MRGYLTGPQMPPDEGWWPMGDVGRVLADGSLELLDRIIDHVEGVESLLVAEDRLLDRFPGLVEIILVPNGSGGLDAVACPAPGRALSVEGLLDAARELGLGPVQVHVWPWESMPLTGSYKVRRLELRQRLATASRPAASVSASVAADRH
jgi:acyl-CoA synthetase (AMP-forming)/AMP-acid ligase II